MRIFSVQRNNPFVFDPSKKFQLFYSHDEVEVIQYLKEWMDQVKQYEKNLNLPFVKFREVDISQLQYIVNPSSLTQDINFYKSFFDFICCRAEILQMDNLDFLGGSDNRTSSTKFLVTLDGNKKSMLLEHPIIPLVSSSLKIKNCLVKQILININQVSHIQKLNDFLNELLLINSVDEVIVHKFIFPKSSYPIIQMEKYKKEMNIFHGLLHWQKTNWPVGSESLIQEERPGLFMVPISKQILPKIDILSPSTLMMKPRPKIMDIVTTIVINEMERIYFFYPEEAENNTTIFLTAVKNWINARGNKKPILMANLWRSEFNSQILTTIELKDIENIFIYLIKNVKILVLPKNCTKLLIRNEYSLESRSLLESIKHFFLAPDAKVEELWIYEDHLGIDLINNIFANAIDHSLKKIVILGEKIGKNNVKIDEIKKIISIQNKAFVIEKVDSSQGSTLIDKIYAESIKSATKSIEQDMKVANSSLNVTNLVSASDLNSTSNPHFHDASLSVNQNSNSTSSTSTSQIVQTLSVSTVTQCIDLISPATALPTVQTNLSPEMPNFVRKRVVDEAAGEIVFLETFEEFKERCKNELKILIEKKGSAVILASEMQGFNAETAVKETLKQYIKMYSKAITTYGVSINIHNNDEMTKEKINEKRLFKAKTKSNTPDYKKELYKDLLSTYEQAVVKKNPGVIILRQENVEKKASNTGPVTLFSSTPTVNFTPPPGDQEELNLSKDKFNSTILLEKPSEFNLAPVNHGLKRPHQGYVNKEGVLFLKRQKTKTTKDIIKDDQIDMVTNEYCNIIDVAVSRGEVVVDLPRKISISGKANHDSSIQIIVGKNNIASILAELGFKSDDYEIKEINPSFLKSKVHNPQELNKHKVYFKNLNGFKERLGTIKVRTPMI